MVVHWLTNVLFKWTNINRNTIKRNRFTTEVVSTHLERKTSMFSARLILLILNDRTQKQLSRVFLLFLIFLKYAFKYFWSSLQGAKDEIREKGNIYKHNLSPSTIGWLLLLPDGQLIFRGRWSLSRKIHPSRKTAAWFPIASNLRHNGCSRHWSGGDWWEAVFVLHESHRQHGICWHLLVCIQVNLSFIIYILSPCSKS